VPTVTAASTGLCLVEPAAFAFNEGTAASNRFQQESTLDPDTIAAAAKAEFSALASALRQAGIPVAVAADSPTPAKPDAVFPNNWVSFHTDGTVVLYPMLHPSRRAERREAVIDAVKQQLGFIERRRYDLSGEERNGRYLEGTGSLVLDHRERIAYACRSPRTDTDLVAEWARQMGYEPFVFDAATRDGMPVYHTNVVMWIGAAVAGLGLEWVAPSQREALAGRLRTSGRDLLELDDAQLHSFAGNMLEVPAGDRRLLLASERAATSLSQFQFGQLSAAGSTLVSAPIPLIEQLGGGSVRCMLAEVPLPAAATTP
jgi:hypothetical protein